MALPTPQSPTLALPRITAARFKQLLKTKKSPAVPESDQVYAVLLQQKVDPSFALAQFRVESQYGTAGFAKETGSWGNMLWDANLTKLATGKKTYKVGRTFYTYATYDNYVDAITDYCRYIYWYITEYGLTTIFGATARWIGKQPGEPGHTSYVTTIIDDMIDYEYPEGTFYEAGDAMIYGGPSFDRATGKIVQRYPVTKGMILYRGTNGDILKKYQGPSSDPKNPASYAWFLGPVNGSWDWGCICIGTSSADDDATWLYIKKPSKNKVINV